MYTSNYLSDQELSGELTIMFIVAQVYCVYPFLMPF